MTAISHRIMTFTGKTFDLDDVASNEFDILAIAHSLSNLARFNGHTRVFYSVAQHSLHVSSAVPPEHALAALLHDAAESFIGDVVNPLKRRLPDFRDIEHRIEEALFASFGISLPLHPCIKEADTRLLVTEQRDLMPPGAADWALEAGIEPLQRTITPLSPEKAKRAFLARFYSLRALAA